MLSICICAWKTELLKIWFDYVCGFVKVETSFGQKMRRKAPKENNQKGFRTLLIVILAYIGL